MMNTEISLDDIHYFEFKVINELMHAHIAEYGNALRAMIVFGRTKIAGPPFDIELLEIIDGWQGLSHFQSGPSDSLRMRGKLYMHFLSAAEFETFAFQDAKEADEAQVLMAQVIEDYKIIYEVPAGYARNILYKVREAQQSYPPTVYLADPFKPPLLHKG